MKKTTVCRKTILKSLLFIVAFFGITSMGAQVTFKPGVRAGINFAHFTEGNSFYNGQGNYTTYDNNGKAFSSKTDFYAGIYGALHLTKHYTLQPEITYSNQGAIYNYIPFDDNASRSTRLNVSYLSTAIINKFYFNKFNFHVGPTIDFVVDKNYAVENDVDFAFVLGAGYDITPNFGIEARVKKGIVPTISDNYANDHTNVVFSIGVTYTFNTK